MHAFCKKKKKNRAVYDNVEKYDTARQATNDNIIQRRKDAICMPDRDMPS
jgi:hypothetical protein